MKFVNANTVHNILNIGLIVVGGITGGLLAAGCTENAAGVISCTHALIDPTYLGYVVTAIGALKVAMNVVRDGFTGLVKPQPPVKQ